jgi:hypothetical protein
LKAYCKSPYRDRPGATDLTIPNISPLGRSRYSPKDFATANWDPMYVLNFLSDMGIKRSEQTSDNDIGNRFCNHDDFAALSCLGAVQGIRFQKVKQ